MLSIELLNELKVIIKEEFKVEVTQQEIIEIANALVNFFDLALKITVESTGGDLYGKT